MTIDAWHDTVQKMIDRGARGTPEEFDLVMDFLYQNVTPVDVNHADPEMLMAVLHAPQAAVDAIVTRRQTPAVQGSERSGACSRS